MSWCHSWTKYCSRDRCYQNRMYTYSTVQLQTIVPSSYSFKRKYRLVRYNCTYVVSMFCEEIKFGWTSVILRYGSVCYGTNSLYHRILWNPEFQSKSYQNYGTSCTATDTGCGSTVSTVPFATSSGKVTCYDIHFDTADYSKQCTMTRFFFMQKNENYFYKSCELNLQ